MTFEHLERLMQAVGFEKLHERWKVGARWSIGSFANELLPLTSRNEPSLDSRRRKYFRDGQQRNNFSILI